MEKSLIVGWQQILQKMNTGSKWEVFIPQELAYGIRGVASNMKGEYVIPPSSTLIFEVELISIVE